MNKNKIPKFKKDIKDFLTQEEGNMVKKDVVKMGVGLLALSIGLKTGMGANDVNAATCIGCCGGSGCAPSSHCLHFNY